MQRHILASLHQNYFLEMLSGKKTHEYRNSVDTQKLTLPFFVVWYITTPTASIQGISACDKDVGKGIPLIETIRLEKSISLSELREKFFDARGNTFQPPQSFMYLREDMKTLIEQRNPKLQDFYNRHPITFTPIDEKQVALEKKLAAEELYRLQHPDLQYKLDF